MTDNRKRGRPKKESTRLHQIHVWLDDYEYGLVKSEVDRKNSDVSTVVRDLIYRIKVVKKER